MSLISGIAQDIFENELDSTGVTLVSVSGWLNENLGALNTLLNTQFSGVAGEITDFNQEEKDIYKELYLHHYYKKQARNALIKIVNDNAGNIISVQDGDNSITFTNKNEVSKLYRGFANDSKERIDDLVYKYNVYRGSPRQVGGIEVSGNLGA